MNNRLLPCVLVLDATREVLRVCPHTCNGARTKNLAETIAVLREKRGPYEVMSAELVRTGKAQISLTDQTAGRWPPIRTLASATIFKSLSTQSTK